MYEAQSGREPTPSESVDATRGTALRWLRRLGVLLAGSDPRLADWEVRAEPGRVIARATYAGATLTLAGRVPDEARAWLRTRSAAWNVDLGGDAATSDAVQAFIRHLRSVLERGDHGQLTLPLSHGVGGSKPVARRDAPAAQRARAALEDELHRAAFIAWKVNTRSDLYPHSPELGVDTPIEDIEAGWRRSLARIDGTTAPDRLGLYIHIPFCAVECTYCFCSKTSKFKKGAIDDYMAKMYAELERFGALFGGRAITSVYVGGGTPSLLRADQMERMFETLYGAFNVPLGTQVIYEGNPDSLNPAKIQVLGSVGRVSRLTIGVQALEMEAQRRARRFNRPEEVRSAVEAAHAAGIEHVNVDLMTGLDGQTLEGFQEDVRFILSLQPESIHVNPFRVQGWSPYGRRGQTILPEQRRLRDEMLRWGRLMMREHGFSTPLGQTASKTKNAANIQEYDLRRQNSSLLGLGVPARSHAFGSYYYEAAIDGDDIAGTLERDRTQPRRYRALAVDDVEERHRYLVHNLRTGFKLSEFDALFGTTPWEAAPKGWQRLDDLGLVEVVGDDVVTDLRNTLDEQIHRVLLYGDFVLDRVEAVWGAQYDRSVDYAGRLALMLEDDSRGV
ncbi:MAG: radical SAM protein [Deltaproteobacteria bacterium]|nr:MAG: radical SAM protein [Deltaproteobacteria bacterium]